MIKYLFGSSHYCIIRIVLLFSILYLMCANLTYAQFNYQEIEKHQQKVAQYLNQDNRDSLYYQVNKNDKSILFLDFYEIQFVYFIQGKYQDLMLSIEKYTPMIAITSRGDRQLHFGNLNPDEREVYGNRSYSWNSFAAFFQRNRQNLEWEVAHANLSDEDQFFLQAYLNYIMFEFEKCDIENQTKMNESASRFVSSYPNSRWTPTVEKLMIRQHVLGNVDYTFNVGFNTHHFSSQMSNYITNKALFSTGASIGVKDWILNFQLSGGSSVIQKEFDYEGIWTKDSTATNMEVGLTFGKRLTIRDRVNVTPYVGYNFHSLSSKVNVNGEFKRADMQQNELMIGTSLDFIFKRSFCITPNTPLEPSRNALSEYYFIRINGGYIVTDFSKFNDELMGNYLYLGAQFGLYLRSVKTKTRRK
jgi:hypothetical protein